MSESGSLVSAGARSLARSLTEALTEQQEAGRLQNPAQGPPAGRRGSPQSKLGGGGGGTSGRQRGPPVSPAVPGLLGLRRGDGEGPGPGCTDSCGGESLQNSSPAERGETWLKSKSARLPRGSRRGLWGKVCTGGWRRDSRGTGPSRFRKRHCPLRKSLVNKGSG